jgi:hypothetical protein
MANKSGKSRKHGNNKAWCTGYKNSNRREKNKVRRINRHLKKFPSDECATAAKKRAEDTIRGIKPKAA